MLCLANKAGKNTDKRKKTTDKIAKKPAKTFCFSTETTASLTTIKLCLRSILIIITSANNQLNEKILNK